MSLIHFHAQTLKATLAKKELQETFLEFDLLGVLKRWLQVMERGMGLEQRRPIVCFDYAVLEWEFADDALLREKCCIEGICGLKRPVHDWPSAPNSAINTPCPLVGRKNDETLRTLRTGTHISRIRTSSCQTSPSGGQFWS